VEDQVQDRVTNGGDNVVRVKRIRKRRRSSQNKDRPWYKSKRLKYRLGILGKMLLVVTLLAAVATIAYILTTVQN
jgi:hypothetical protein